MNVYTKHCNHREGPCCGGGGSWVWYVQQDSFNAMMSQLENGCWFIRIESNREDLKVVMAGTPHWRIPTWAWKRSQWKNIWVLSMWLAINIPQRHSLSHCWRKMWHTDSDLPMGTNHINRVVVLQWKNLALKEPKPKRAVYFCEST